MIIEHQVDNDDDDVDDVIHSVQLLENTLHV